MYKNYTREQDNAYLVDWFMDAAVAVVRALAMAIPTATTVGLTLMVTPIIGIAALALAVPAAIVMLFRAWRVKRSHLWTSERERMEERARFNRDAYLCGPIMGAGIVNGLVLLIILAPKDLPF